jgi:hypothetical protein
MHKQTSGIWARVSWLLPVTAMSMAMLGCPGQELAPLSPCTVSAVTERVDQAGVSDVDLLFMIDNSGSMAPKQLKLAEQLPRLLSVLTSGDRCADLAGACPYDDNSMPKRNFTAVKSLHLGVVTSNLGGIDNIPPNSSEGIRSCEGTGDEGKLQNSVTVAVNGLVAGRNQFPAPIMEGDVLIPPDSDCEISGIDTYQDYIAGESSLDDVKAAFKCVSRVGALGCPFEQQLESAWKALAPSAKKGEDFEFLNGTKGQGDDYNEGFLRDEAILAIVLVTDEDDCAITEDGKPLFLPPGDPGYMDAEATYGALNLRCGLAANDQTLIRPTDRYFRAFSTLKPENADRIIFAAITGIPPEANGMPIDDILALPEMQFVPAMGADGKNTGVPTPSCFNSTGKEVSYPPIRITKVVQDFGDQGILYSICEDDYAPALNLLIEKIANKLKGNCLPRKLNPTAEGKVNCEVFELLPLNGKQECDAEYGHLGDVVERTVREGTENKKRKACRMNQVPINIDASGGKTAGDGYGWYYDDFNPELAEECPIDQRQRIQFRFADGTGDLRSGAGATFECFQPVARIDKDATGFDAVNTSCREDQNSCSDKSDPAANGYKLVCIEGSKTCQITCKSNPDCPPGWVCEVGSGGDIKFCQQPTCPQDNNPPSDEPAAEN